MTLEVTDQTFRQEAMKGKTLVDFWASWCGPCKMLGPVVDELSTAYEGKIKIVKLNVDENPTVANAYKVMSVPTLIYFEDGVPVERIVGFQPKPVLKKYLDSKLSE